MSWVLDGGLVEALFVYGPDEVDWLGFLCKICSINSYDTTKFWAFKSLSFFILFYEMC